MDEPSKPEPAGPLVERFFFTSLAAKEIPTFLTAGKDSAPGPALTLPKDEVQAAFRFHGSRQVEGDYIFYPIVETRVADRSGQWWSARSFLDPDVFCGPLEPEIAELEGAIHYWHKAPEAWRRAILAGCDLKDVSALLDSRMRFEMKVGDEKEIIMMKYQGPEMDVAWTGEEQGFVVRAKSMVFEQWEGDPFDPKESERAKCVDIIDGVTLCYCVPLDDVVLFSAPEYHWREWEQWHETEDPALCRPLFETCDAPATD